MPSTDERIGMLDVDALSAWVVAAVGARFREVEHAYEENRAAALQLMDETKVLKAEVDRLRQQETALRDVVEFSVKTNTDRSGIVAPEDAEILALCERLGFGAVMDSASRQWRARDERGAFTVGLPLTMLCAALDQREEVVSTENTDKPN